MKFDIELLLNVLWIAMICQTIAIITTQKFKSLKTVKKSWQVIMFSLILNIVLSVCFSLTYTNLSLIYSLWVGFFSFIGADTLYKSLEEKKLLKSLTDVSEKEGM